MKHTDPYFKEVIDAHVEIAQWLGGTAAHEALPALLARFAASFTMITPMGAKVDHAGLTALFSDGFSRRPGLKITIDELVRIDVATGHTAVVSYREHQVDGAGNETLRRSTAAFFTNAHGKVQWRHLHETFCHA